VGALLEPVGPLGAGTYWRRRLTVIAVLLVLLWLITRIGGDDESASAADGNAVTVTTPSPSAPEPSPSTDTGGVGDSASPPPTEVPLVPPTAGPASDPTPGAAGQPAAPEGTPTTAAHGPQPCRAGELSLTVDPSSARYAEAVPPELKVTVDTTGAAPCTQNLGASVLGVVITSGQDRIWGSRDCATATPDVRVVTPGAPVTVPIAWNRVRSAPGCPSAGAPARAGTYVATPVAGDRTGKRASFLLD